MERLLNSDADQPTITIMPNGSIRELTDEEKARLREDYPKKPLTLGNDLGGEYGL